MNNLAARRAPHDGVVNQQDGFILKLQRHRIELLPHRLFPLTLPRHDESAANVAIFHKAFAELDPQFVGQRLPRNPAGIRNRNHDIDIVLGSLSQNLFGQRCALAHARLIDRDAIDERIGTREINVFKNAGG